MTTILIQAPVRKTGTLYPYEEREFTLEVDADVEQTPLSLVHTFYQQHGVAWELASGMATHAKWLEKALNECQVPPTTYTSSDGYTYHRVFDGFEYIWVASPTPEDPDTWDMTHGDKEFKEVFIPEDQEALADLERMKFVHDQHPDLAGIVCSCGSKGPFRMGLTVMCTVHDDGHVSDVDTSGVLDDLAYPQMVTCVCNECNRIANLKKFLPTQGEASNA